MYALIHAIEIVKTVTKQNTRSKSITYRLGNVYKQEHLSQIQAKLVSYLEKEIQRALRASIEKAVISIACFSFPCYFKDLYSYMQTVVKDICTALETNTFTPNKQSLMMLKTLGNVFKEMVYQTRLSISPEFFINLSQDFLPAFIQVWQKFKDPFGSQQTIALEYSIAVDEIFVYFLRLAHKSCLEQDMYVECLKNIFSKSQIIATHCKEIGDSGFDNPDYIELLEENLIILIFEFILILKINPYAFNTIFPDILSFCTKIIEMDWKIYMVPKVAMLSIYQHLNEYLLITPPEKILNLVNKGVINAEQKSQIAHSQLRSFFLNDNNIEKIMNRLLSYTMMLLNDGEEDIDEAHLETTPGKFDRINSQIDFNNKQIGLCVIDKLIDVFPEVSLPLLVKLINNVVSGELDNLPKSVSDNVLSILIRTPETLSKKHEEYLGELNIMTILQYIHKNSADNILLKRRLPSIVEAWYSYLPQGSKNELISVLIALLPSEDNLTQFNTISCLNKFIIDPNIVAIDFGALLRQCVPVVVGLAEKLESASMIYKTLTIINSTILKLVDLGRFDPTLYLSNLNIEKILRNYNQDIANILMEMVKSVIQKYPMAQYLHGLYVFAFQIIQHCRPYANEEDDQFINFWTFIVKEIPNTPESAEVVKGLVDFLKQNVGYLHNIKEVNQSSKAINLIDEYLLLTTDLGFDIFDYLKLKQEWADNLPESGDNLKIKTSLFMVYSTLTLISLQRNQFSLEKFSSCLTMACQIIENYKSLRSFSEIISLSQQTASIFARYLILDAKSTLAFISQNTDLTSFVASWAQMLKEITAKKVLRICTVALLSSVQVFPLDALLPSFEELMEISTREIILFTMNPGYDGVQQKSRNRLQGYSYRKEELRSCQLFKDHNLVQVFQRAMNIIKQRIESEGKHLSFSNEVIQQNIDNIMAITIPL